MNPYLYEVYAQEKRREMLEEAARDRLVAEYENGREGARQRLRVRVGELLIRAGEWLKGSPVGELPTHSGLRCR